MPSQSKVKVTAMEKLDGVLGILGVVLRTLLFSSLGYPFKSAVTSQPTFGREIVRLLVRRIVARLNVAQTQWVWPATSVVYKDWMGSNAATEDAPGEMFTELIGNEGTKLHWVGRKDATKVILHFHGGGFVMTLTPGHLNLISYLRRETKRLSGVEVKTAFLEYTLLPDHKYPSQFRQAALALQHIIDSGISPSNIIISGDSAGGQLALQILSHILHPHPDIPRLQISESAPLAGILPMSPWVVFDSTSPSFVNNTTDIVPKKTLVDWGKLMTDGTAIANGKVEPNGFWGEPLKAPPAWWRDTASATRNLMVVYGAREVFLDDNVTLVKNIREGVAGTKVNVTSVEDPKGIHIGPIFDSLLGRTPSETSKAMALWVNELLSK